MTSAQQQALNTLKAVLKRAGAIFTIDQIDDKIHVAHKKPQGHWYGHITIMPDGGRQFGRPKKSVA